MPRSKHLETRKPQRTTRPHLRLENTAMDQYDQTIRPRELQIFVKIVELCGMSPNLIVATSKSRLRDCKQQSIALSWPHCCRDSKLARSRLDPPNGDL